MKISRVLKLVGAIILVLLLLDESVMIWSFSAGVEGTATELVVESIVTILELVIFIVLLAITWRKVLAPLHQISETIPKIAGGDLTKLLPEKTRDEFGQFAAAFNEMVKNQQRINDALDKKVKEKTAELERLLHEYEKFKLAVDSASDHVVISDKDGVILYANKASETTTGYSVSEMVGKKAGKLWALPMDKNYYEKLWHVIKHEKRSFVGSIKNKRKSGEVYDALISISPVLDENGEPQFFVGLERDISKEQLIDRAKTEFVSVASHQLRTPLAAMNWNLEILRSGADGPLNEKQREYLSEIENGNRRMIELVNNLLNASRFELGTFSVRLDTMDLRSVLEGVVIESRPLLKKKNIELTVDMQNIPPMKLDPELTRFVFQNLLTNAIKYTPANGSVAIRLHTSDNDAVIEIEDTGVGIPSAFQENIFQKFFRADNIRRMDTEGTGLGLYIVKSVIESTGGKVWFESEENVGTSFYVSLPLTGMKDPRRS